MLQAIMLHRFALGMDITIQLLLVKPGFDMMSYTNNLQNESIPYCPPIVLTMANPMINPKTAPNVGSHFLSL